MRPLRSLQDITNRRVKEQDELLEAVTRELKTANLLHFKKQRRMNTDVFLLILVKKKFSQQRHKESLY
jgi:hypothetical protein